MGIVPYQTTHNTSGAIMGAGTLGALACWTAKVIREQYIKRPGRLVR